MNILFAANGFIERGKPKQGFPNYLYRVSRALLDMGHKVIVVACGDKSVHRFVDGIEVYDVAVYYSDISPKWADVIVNDIRASWCVNKKIREILKNTKIDIIQFTTLQSIGLLYYGKTPAVMRLSAYTKHYYATFSTMAEKTVKVRSFFEIMAGKRCNAVFGPSRVEAKAYEEDFHKKVYVIETPFVNDVKQYDNRIVEQQLQDKKYVLFFGLLYYEKGILTIAEMLECFLANHSDYFWVFAGKISTIQGKNAAKILSEAAGQYSNQLIFTGALPHEQLYPVIQNAEFVVLPSIMDNFPNACIEAMYFSKIVVGTDGASFEQLIQDGVNGFLCKIGDSRDLLCKVEKAVSLPQDTKRQMEVRAHKRIERLKPERVVKQLLKFYEYVIRSAK